jgi:hypothetical protein
MGITGSGVNDPNLKFRFLVIMTLGILAVGSVLYWRSQLFLAAEYQDLPVTRPELEIKKKNEIKKKSFQEKANERYQLK